MKKYLSIILSFVLIIFLCCACSEGSSGEKNTLSNKKQDSEIVDLLNQTTEGKSSKNPNQMQMSGSIPEYMRGWNDKKSDNDVIYTYEGGEFVVSHHISNGSFKTVYGLCVLLDGVFQDFYIIDENSKEKSEQSKVLTLTMEKDAEKSFEIHFVPNIGKKGDTLELSVGLYFNYNYTIHEGATFLNYGNNHDFRDVKCRRIRMDADCKNEERIEEYTSEIMSINKDVLDVHNYDEPDETIITYIYTDSIKDGVAGSAIKAVAKSKNDYYLDLIAPTGVYRVSVFIDHIQQELYDGVKYFDVKTQTGKTSHIKVTLDNTKLSGWHHIYYMVRRIDGQFDYAKTTTKSDTYILILQ